MGRRFIRLQSNSRGSFFTVLFIAAVLLPGCDSENDKAWKKWRVEAGKVDYRCGMFNNYEFRINRAYLFFWPTYQGRSDWEVKGPPPLSCDAQLETVPMEAYWPGMQPAGTHTEQNLGSPDRIYINLNSVSDLKKWDLVLNLDHRFGEGEWKKTPNYQKNKNNLGLDYTEGPNRGFKKITSEYYWTEELDGTISTFIECFTVNSKIEADCHQDQYIPDMKAILKITYKKSKLKDWKKIRVDVVNFVKRNAEYKGV